MSSTDKPQIGILDDYAELAEFSRQVKRVERTVLRWMDEPDGLPYTMMGRTRLVHIPTARAWLQARMRNPNPTRGTLELAHVT